MFYCIHVLFYSISLCPISLYYVLLCLFHFIIIFYFLLLSKYSLLKCSILFHTILFKSIRLFSLLLSSSIGPSVASWLLQLNSQFSPSAPPSSQPSLPPALPQWEQRCGSQTSEVLLVWWPRLRGACGQQVQIQGNHKC